LKGVKSAMGDKQRGEVKFGCVLYLFLFVIGCYLVYMVGPVYWDKLSFEDEFQRIVNRAGVEGWSDTAIREQVEKSLNSLGFQMVKEGLEVRRVNRYQAVGRLRVVVRFSRRVDFPGFSHDFVFTSEHEALRGRL
jgi:hypothetical protein